MPDKNTPPIQWVEQKLDVSVFQGGARSTSITFISSKNLDEVSISVTPRLAQFVQVTPTSTPQISKEIENTLELLFTIPNDIPTGSVGGTLQIKSGKKTIAQSLPVIIDVISSQVVEEKILDFLIQQFGTSTPTIPPDQKFLIASSTPEIEDLLTEGTNLLTVFKLSSVVFLRELVVDVDVTEAIDDLLPLVDDEGFRIQDIIATLPTHRWHRDDLDNPILPVATTLTFNTVLPDWSFSDRDLDGRADFLIVIPDDNTHTILQSNDADELIARNFVAPLPKGTQLLEAASTATHELAHILNFRTECGGGILFYNFQREENYVTDHLEPFIKNLFLDEDTNILNSSVDTILSIFPNTENCLERLDLTRPMPITVNAPTNISTSTVMLSWTQNTDRDFASYQIFRDTAAGIDSGDTLVATITDFDQTSFTDADLSPNTTYFYKVFVFDKAGLSKDSNEMSATTLTTFPPIWSTLKRDAQHTGLSPFSGPPFATSTDVNVRWQTTLPGIVSQFSPLIGGNGSVIIGSGNQLFSLNGATGAIQWNTITPGIMHAGAIGPDGTIYVCSNNVIQATLSAFEPTNGVKQWDFVVGGPRPCVAPVVDTSGVIYTAVPPPLNIQTASVVAVNPDGSERWRFEEFANSATSPALSLDETQLYAATGNTLRAFDTTLPATTTILWSRTGGFENAEAVLVDPSDRVILSDRVSLTVHRLKAYSKSGTLLWTSANIGQVLGSPALLPNGDLAMIGRALVAPSRLFIINSVNGFTLLNFGLRGGRTSSQVAIDNNSRVYVGSTVFDIGLESFDTTTAQTAWFFPTTSTIPTGPAIGEDGTLYFVAGDTVFALGE